MTDPETPIGPISDTPTGDDPYVRGSLPDSDGNEQPKSKPPTDLEGPSYERDQDPEDRTGGSSDPHNTLSNTDSGIQS